jgi:hypothetical protein
MPTRERVQEFIRLMEANQSLELMPAFYAEDATAQENELPPRVGLAALMEHERQALERGGFESVNAAAVLIDGDHVAINWVFVFISNGQRLRLDEIALQQWRGDRIVRERYFYDPAQLRKAL